MVCYHFKKEQVIDGEIFITYKDVIRQEALDPDDIIDMMRKNNFVRCDSYKMEFQGTTLIQWIREDD